MMRGPAAAILVLPVLLAAAGRPAAAPGNVPAVPPAAGTAQSAAVVPSASGDELDGGAKALRAAALAAMSAGDYAGAIEPLERILERYPDRYEETLYLGRCYIGAGMFDEAGDFLSSAMERWPGDRQLTEMLGRARLETGDREGAVETWHSMLTGRADEVGVYMRVARMEWEAGMFDRAIGTLREARDLGALYSRLTAEIVKMERTRGNYRGAFLEALYGFERDERPDLSIASGAIRSFRDAGSPPELIAVVDSLAVDGEGDSSFFRALHAALLVDTGDYGAASHYLVLAGSGPGTTDRELYSFVMYLYSLGSKKGDPAFEGYLDRASSTYIRRFGSSPRAPRILLEQARHAAGAAERGGPAGRRQALRAIALADSVISHELGRPYAERAALIEARVYLERLGDPASALAAVDSREWRNPRMAREAQRIRLEALVLSGRWNEAAGRFEAMAASPDSSVAAEGRYGKGMVLFYMGRFDESVKVLSAMAAEAPWSRWANDALATAVLIRRAGADDPDVLAAFASAMTAAGNGGFPAAADSLAAVAARYPRSPLAPEAAYRSALLLERSGRLREAESALEGIVEKYPLSRTAPRAVEKLAGMLEESDPEGSARWYALFFERYGDDPWATRVRGGYERLRKRTGDGQEGRGGT